MTGGHVPAFGVSKQEHDEEVARRGRNYTDLPVQRRRQTEADLAPDMTGTVVHGVHIADTEAGAA